MGAIEAAIGIGLGAYGRRPRVPDFTPTDPLAEQLSAIRGNLSSFEDASRLGTTVNRFNFGELDRMNEAAIPGFANILGRQSNILQSFLRGELPDDVSQQVMRNSAWTSLRGGYGGSEMGRNLTARDLGLTSLDLMNRGMDSSSAWMANTQRLRVPGLFDVTSMFLTPAQRIEVANYNNEMLFRRHWLAEQVAAMPDPNMAALAGGFGADLSSAGSLLGQYLGAQTGFGAGPSSALTQYPAITTQPAQAGGGSGGL